MFERVFKLSEHKTTVKTEVMAGITTFMTMAYILAVNPSVLGSTGMDTTAVLLATAWHPAGHAVHGVYGKTCRSRSLPAWV